MPQPRFHIGLTVRCVRACKGHQPGDTGEIWFIDEDGIYLKSIAGRDRVEWQIDQPFPADCFEPWSPP